MPVCNLKNLQQTFNDIGLLILRLALGILMLFHGIAKMSEGIGDIKLDLADNGLPEIMAYGVHLGETVAPILIIVGFLIRPAAAIFAFTMIMAVYLTDGISGFSLNDYGGVEIELNLLYMFGALALCFTGAGRLSLWNLLMNKSKNEIKKSEKELVSNA
ncbi:DoxX family protein [Planctomycetota bacterium]|nr:DoxX family protein [Planctomycetota bacterium]